MPNSILTTAGLALFVRAQAEGLTVPIDKMIFADIPDLDPEQTPDPAAGLPAAEQIVFEGAIENTGKIADDTVVYSRILAATDGTFYLNWIGLYSTAYATLVAVCAVHRHKKYATDGFKAGNTLYKNLAIQYANASALTGITIDAASWQYDLSTRYAPKDHNHDDRYEPKDAVEDHNDDPAAHSGLFNDKANKNLDNLELPAALANLGFAQSAAETGYVKLPGGLIVQWGRGVSQNCSTGANEVYTDTFGLVFPTACLWVIVALLAPDAVDKTRLTNCGAVTTSWTAGQYVWGLDRM